MKKIGITLLCALLIILTACTSNNKVTMDDVKSIRAYLDSTFYGTGVTKIEVTYKNNSDLSSIDKDSYIIEDRGSLNPDFGELKVKSVEVNDNVVTINILHDFDATENNSLIYTGENTTIRERNSYGVLVSTGWYRDVDGKIHYGDNNPNNIGYQSRANLDLRLRHVWDDESAMECLTNENGNFNSSSKWLESINSQLDTFENLLDLKIESTAGSTKDNTGDKYVRGYYYVPDNYNPKDGIVFTLQGQAISYWRIEDGTDNEGTGLFFDSATSSWASSGAIVVNIHDRSSYGKNYGTFWETYDFVLDDVNVMKYFIDKYNISGNIVLQGNSRGTMASAMIIKALAGQGYNPKNQEKDANYDETYLLDKEKYDFDIDAYICQNGFFGYQYDEDDWKAVSETDLMVWAFNGEQDTDDFDGILKYKEMMTNKNGEQWANNNIRLTAYCSELFYPFGESDHSIARVNGWFFSDTAYYGPDLKINESGQIVYSNQLNDGDTYSLKGRGAGLLKSEHKYKIYDEPFHKWALKKAS